jgi:mono/diheme cytochrome c family protein
LYQSPDILSEMPPLSVLENEVLASILSYIRQAWGHASDPIDSNEVARVRAATVGRQTPWTEKELLSIP